MTTLQPRIKETIKLFKRIKKLQLFRVYSSELTHSELQLLMLIFSNNHNMSIKTLMQLLSITHSSTIQLVNALEYKGYIIRQSDPSDKRITHLSLTENGLQFAETLHNHNMKVFEKLLLKYDATLEDAICKMNDILNYIEDIPLIDISPNRKDTL